MKRPQIPHLIVADWREENYDQTYPEQDRAIRRMRAQLQALDLPPAALRAWTRDGAWMAPLVAETMRSTLMFDDETLTTVSAAEVADLIEQSDKYVVSLPVLQMADELADAAFELEPLNPNGTWIEWLMPTQRPDAKLISFAVCMGLAPGGALSGRVFLHGEGRQHLDSFAFWREPGEPLTMHMATKDNPLARWILGVAAAVCELVRHPRAVHKQHHEAGKRLKRVKGGLKAEHRAAFTEVVVHVLRDADPERAETEPGHVPKFHKRFHHVRPFARVRLGKTELVVGHWRGDPKLGVLAPRNYRVTR